MESQDKKTIQVLIVDDSPTDREIFKQFLKKDSLYSYRVTECDTGAGALEICRVKPPDCILLDYLLPDLNGADFLRALAGKALTIGIPVVMLTGQEDEQISKEIIRLGAQCYRTKQSISTTSLRRSIINAIEKVMLNSKLEKHQEELERQNIELLISKKNFQNVIKNSSTALIVMDASQVIQFCNPAAERLFGKGSDRLLGQNFDYPINVEKSMELIIPGEDEQHIAEMQVTEVIWEGSKAFLASLRDISEHKRLAKMKSDFISIVSHELRTPLTAIRNAIGILASRKAGPLTDNQDRFVSMAERNIKRLAAMINDFLDFSKIEAGKMSFSLARVDLIPLLKHLQATYQPEASAASLDLVLDVPPSLPSCYVDPNRVEQILCNLLSNAIKFTPAKGKVILYARESPGFLLVSVKDSGIGISAENQARIFEPFFEVCEDTLTRPTKGTGLGLSITKYFVEAQGGSISVDSELGKGSCFTVTLPKHTDRLLERMALQDALRSSCENPCFSMLLVQLPEACAAAGNSAKAALEALEARVRAILPRKSDLILQQPVSMRLVIVLPSTTKEGAVHVQEKLRRELQVHPQAGDGHLPPPAIIGPFSNPEDGKSISELINNLQTYMTEKNLSLV